MMKKLLLASAFWPGLAQAQFATTTTTPPVGDNSNRIADTAFVQGVATSQVNIRAFGAKCDGSTDDSAAINSAIAASQDGSGRGGTVTFPSGVICVINSSVTWNNIIGGIANGNNVTIAWGGNSTTPAFIVQDVQFARFNDFVITTLSGKTLQTAIQSIHTSTGRINTSNQYYNITVRGFNGVQTIGKGWQFALGSGGDVNNDQNIFVGCNVYYTSSAGWSFEHSQSVGHRLYGNNANAATIGVATSLGTGTNGGSFSWYGGSIANSSVADFQIGTLVGDPMTITGVHSEGSNRLFQMVGGSSSGAKPLLIDNFDYQSNSVNADEYAIVLNGSGPFSVRSGRFDGTSQVKIQINSTTNSTLDLMYNNFDTPSSNTQASLVDTTGGGTATINRAGNIFADGSFNPAFRTDDVISVSSGGTGDSGLAWSTFTPSPSCGSATFTVNSARYKVLGKVTRIEADIAISTLGTCSNQITVNLPNTSNSAAVISGREVVNNSAIAACTISASVGTMGCVKQTTTLIAYAANDRIVVSGVYENQ